MRNVLRCFLLPDNDSVDLLPMSRGDTGRLPGLADIATVTQLANSLLSENGVSLAEDDLVKDVCLSSWGQSLPVCSILGKLGCFFNLLERSGFYHNIDIQYFHMCHLFFFNSFT